MKHLYRKTIRGVAYVYFRPPAASGLKPIALPRDESSAEFRRAYARCLKALETNKRTAVALPAPVNKQIAFLPDSIGRAIATYQASDEFDALGENTKPQYRRALQVMCDKIGRALLRDMGCDELDLYTEWLAKTRGRSVADFHLVVFRTMWRIVRKHDAFGIKQMINPAIDAKRRYTIQREHRPWPVDTQGRFMEVAPDHLQLAKLLLHFGAQRGGDCTKMLWSDYDGAGLIVRPEKTMGEGAELPNYHYCPKPLREALDRTPRVAPTILVSKWGRPWASAQSLSFAIRRVLRATGDSQKGVRTFSMHGLRKTAASDVASLGVGVSGIKSITGHVSNRMAEKYAKFFDAKRVNKATVAVWDAELEAQAADNVRTRRARIRRVK